MNCPQFENALSDYLEGDATSEQRAHLSSCSACSGLLADLSLISAEASSLRELDGPSDKVWNLLEAQLRREGLIKQPSSRPSQPDFFHRWRTAWLVPVAAALLIAAGIKLYQPAKIGDNQPVAKQHTPATVVPVVSAEDKDIMNTVASRPPAQVAAYRNDLAQANSFIRDAQEAVRNDPNDIYSQQMLMNAYEQKQMVYRLAVDQSNEDEQ
jgi:predicted anti-sigma-YlaC factor YlaD